MKYHIFEINPFQQLTYLQSLAEYREAKACVRELRQKPDLTSGTTFRMMFAADPEHAERLLKEKREPRPMGEHD
ncbi:hypothetical protein AB833_31730 [Chromatiales bacterium (ex Bugula neritina AB1)]|nr:hypothetical protein AB833_31730 [Chromatiales bacterium (ex Bugula neritina AB1)]